MVSILFSQFPQNVKTISITFGDWNLNTTQELISFCLLNIWTSVNLTSQNSWPLVCVYFRWHFVVGCFVFFSPSKVETDQLLILVFPVCSTPMTCIYSLLISVHVLCITTYLWPTNVSVAHDRRVQSFGSNIGSNPPSRCCLLAESIHVWHRALGFVQICAIYLNFVVRIQTYDL